MATSFYIPTNEPLVSDGSKLFTPDQYHLGVFFRMPHEGSSRRVIAVDKSMETTLVSLYTMFITGSIMGVWILVAMAVSYFTSKSQFQHDYLLRSACAWKVTEPFQAAMLMAKYCWIRMRWIFFRPRFRRRSAHGGGGGGGGIGTADLGQSEQYYSQADGRYLGGGGGGEIGIANLGQSGQYYSQAGEGYLGGGGGGGGNGNITPPILSGSRSARNSFTETPVSPSKELALGVFILSLAIFVFAGGILAGIFLPAKLVVGHIAPVNQHKVFLPNQFNSTAIQDYTAELSYLVTSRITRAMGAVDSSALGQLNNTVQVYKNNTRPGPMGEDSYDIVYRFSVSGVEMGLQTLPDLGFHVEGECEFEYSWYNGTEISPVDNVMYDTYTVWGEEDNVYRVDLNSTCVRKEENPTIRLSRDTPQIPVQPPEMFFILNIYSQGKGSFSQGRDPWYLTGQKLDAEGYGGQPWECGAPGTAGSKAHNRRVLYRIQAGRPMLRCRERMFLSYADDQPHYEIPILLGTESATSSGFEQWLDKLKGSLPDGVKMSRAVAWVLGVNVVRFAPLLENIKGALGHRAGDVSYVLDAGASSALEDVKRITMAAYIATRNLFRDAVLEYADTTVPQELKDNRVTAINALRDPATGAPVPGSGDWVLPSDNVTTLRVELLIGIPAAMGVVWLTIFIMRVFIWRSHVHGECPACGSFPISAGPKSESSPDVPLVPVINNVYSGHADSKPGY